MSGPTPVARTGQASVVGHDPRTGEAGPVVGVESSPADVARICLAAAAAAPVLASAPRAERSALLRAAAEELEVARAEIVATADRETALGTQRLQGELNRTCFQLRLFADVADEGSYLEVAVDTAGTTPAGPRPDLRRIQVPLGPVAVFGASNFPLAFSVPGGDTAAALTAGCPVVVKAHPAHPETSALTFACLERAVRRVGAPTGTIGMVQGREAGENLVRDPRIRAVGFTGSLAGGRALFDLACARPEPVPFYGELGSINPLVVTPAAARTRGREIAEGYVASITLGGGQFCTKPGLLLVPSAEAPALREHLLTALGTIASPWLLSAGIAQAYRQGTTLRAEHPHVERLTPDVAPAAGGYDVPPALFWVGPHDVPHVGDLLFEECFGPAAVVAEYADAEGLLAVLDRLPGTLTGSLHAQADDEQDLEVARAVVETLTARAGRVVYDGFPTGLAVAWSTTHTGPYPSSTSAGFTSVGAGSIRRFLRPVTYQDTPDALLPPELRRVGAVDVPRRVDGVLQVPPPDRSGCD